MAITKTKKKGPGRPPKSNVSESKKLAQQKIDELLEGVDLTKKDKTKIADRVEKSGNAWLESQVTALNDKIEEVENKLIKKTEDYEKLLSEFNNLKATKAAPQQNQGIDDVKKGVLEIYTELLKNYLGQNNTKMRYQNANIEVLLKKFKSKFKFIR